MKNRSFISVLLAAVFVAALSGCSDDSSTASVYPNIAVNGSPVELELSLPESVELEAGSDDLALRAVPVDTSRAKAEVESCFGIDLDKAEKSTDSDFDFYTTDDYSVMIDRQTGYWTYDLPTAEPPVGSLISDEDAIAKASRFVENNELWSGEWGSIKVVSQSGLNSALESAVTVKSVYFYPELDGRDVLGIFRISVDVDMTGRIVSVYKQLGEPEGAVGAALKSRSEIARSIAEGEYSAGVTRELEDVVITEGEYCYYADACSVDGCTYLYPVCVFKAHGTAADGTTESFDIIVSAQK